MKKAAAVFVLIVLLVSCNSKYEQENDEKGFITRKTTEKSPFSDMELEMKGDITFNQDGTEITGISKEGYVKYSNNDTQMDARPGKDNTVAVTVYDKGEEITKDSDKGREIIEDAIGRMQDLQEKYN